jgi:hypothetical protein
MAPAPNRRWRDGATVVDGHGAARNCLTSGRRVGRLQRRGLSCSEVRRGGVDGRLQWRSDSVSKLDGERHSVVHREVMRACGQAEAHASGEVRQRSGMAHSGF